MNDHTQITNRRWFVWLAMIVVAGADVLQLMDILFGGVDRKSGRKVILVPDIQQFPGLTEEEAVERRPGSVEADHV